HNLRGGLKLRMRKWLNPKISLDLSGGAFLWGIDDDELKQPAFIGGASLNFSNWQAVNVLVEILETKPYEYSYDPGSGGMPSRSISPRQRNVGVYLGYKLSSKPGLVFNGLAVAAVGVVFAIFVATFSGFD
ncbi:MAG: hypothetical protein ACRENG_37890, partial [bacterium]